MLPEMTMRVLIACDWFLRYAASQAVALKIEGAEVALLCRAHAHEFGGSFRERRRILEQVEEAGVELFVLPGRVSSLRKLPALAALRRRIRDWAPDIVHAHDNHDPRLLALVHGFPLVLTIHDPTPHLGARSIGGVRESIRAMWRRKATRLVVHGEELRHVLAAREDPWRVEVVPHGTSPRLSPLPVPSSSVLLFFGRLEPYKGLPVLLEALQAVWRHRPEVKLLVAGAGREAAAIPSHPRIETLLGYVPEDRVDELFARASLVVLPYVEGSQSGVGMLALARGLPVVVTDVGSLAELALDPSFVVPPGDAAALAAALLRHLDHGEAVRWAALERARERFSWTVVARRSLDLYQTLLASSRLPAAA